MNQFRGYVLVVGEVAHLVCSNMLKLCGVGWRCELECLGLNAGVYRQYVAMRCSASCVAVVTAVGEVRSGVRMRCSSACEVPKRGMRGLPHFVCVSVCSSVSSGLR